MGKASSAVQIGYAVRPLLLLLAVLRANPFLCPLGIRNPQGIMGKLRRLCTPPIRAQSPGQACLRHTPSLPRLTILPARIYRTFGFEKIFRGPKHPVGKPMNVC